MFYVQSRSHLHLPWSFSHCIALSVSSREKSNEKRHCYHAAIKRAPDHSSPLGEEKVPTNNPNERGWTCCDQHSHQPRWEQCSTSSNDDDWQVQKTSPTACSTTISLGEREREYRVREIKVSDKCMCRYHCWYQSASQRQETAFHFIEFRGQLITPFRFDSPASVLLHRVMSGWWIWSKLTGPFSHSLILFELCHECAEQERSIDILVVTWILLTDENAVLFVACRSYVSISMSTQWVD